MHFISTKNSQYLTSVTMPLLSLLTNLMHLCWTNAVQFEQYPYLLITILQYFNTLQFLVRCCKMWMNNYMDICFHNLPVNSLKIIGRIPCWIKQYNNICSNEVETKTSSSAAETWRSKSLWVMLPIIYLSSCNYQP